MVRKIGLASILKTRETTGGSSSSSSSSPSSASPWPWPSCKHPRTHSFRAAEDSAGVIPSACIGSLWEQESFSNMQEDAGDVPVETVISGLRSGDRLFFEPAGGSSSILGGEAKRWRPPEGSVAVEMESEDPQSEFRASMEEMVAAHGVKNVERLQEMVGWYLRANRREAHAYIVGAFLEVLSMLASFSNSSSSSSSFSFDNIVDDEGSGSA